MKNTETENKMGTLPIGKLVWKMSLPLMASMMFQALYNIVDSVFVSRLGQEAMNAVSLSFPFQILLIAFGTGTGVGMNALLSRSLGAGDRETADKVANTGIFLYIVTALLFSVLGFTLAEPYFRFQTANDVIVNYGRNYLTVSIGCCFGLFGQLCFERLLQSTGRTDLAMIPQIAGAVFNMIFDPILIFGLFGFPRLEVKGAAVATICGQFLALAIGLILNLTKNKEIRLQIRKIRFHASTAKEIYKIGLPSIVMQSISSVMNFFLNYILISFTEAATAVFGAYYKVQSFIFMPVFGLNNAMVSILSYNYGAGKHDRVKQTIRMCVIIAISIMTFGTILFEVIPNVLLGFFNPSEEMLTVGQTAFRIIGTHFPIAGFCIVAGSVCQALRKPTYSLITAVCRQLVVLLPAAWLLAQTGKLDMVWLAFPIAEIASALLNVFFIRSTLSSLRQPKEYTI